MTAIAKKYMRGKDGLPRNRAKGIFWLRKAADNNYPDAMEILAQFYARGKYLSQNSEKAQELFLKLASIDNAYCFKISKFFEEGDSTFPRDELKAIEWLERGTINADATTKLYLAWRYWKGDSLIKQNIEKAIHWCSMCLPKDGGSSQKNPIEKSALKMLKDISQGKLAPKTFAEIQQGT